ncbi:transmembrane protein, putative (macronuclear) [Tetrahymena thermophila SB210]|uniref:Transmembrane protein, putative n=1 Tax=Tetrahymena thermophila (strain SB210) TaxID=312017 RepID=Q23D06_TETTS|nr:transmembrane protein, putative [Tetrahymena thermophila SB210]EAR94591.1 transmembrane protein, putative [Tetrahymena thermophila SB210]|eukprot:XP_001014880.1 transmembrane protein, putative [Tetrahymena thermophila SB210]
MAVNYVCDNQTINNNREIQDEKQISVSTSKLILYFKSLIILMKRWNVCVIVQIIMAGILLISEQQAAKINLIFGLFIPIYQHLVAIKSQRHINSANNSFSSPILNSYNLTKKFGPSSIRLSSPSSSYNSQSSFSSNSSTNSSASINNEKKIYPIEQNVNSERSLQDKLGCAEVYNIEHDINLPLRDDFCLKGLAEDSNKELTHAKSQNISNSRNSLTSTTNTYSVHINQILSYWPMFCVLLIIEQQLLPKSIVRSHEFQILKCLFILILRSYSFSIYLFFKETIEMKAFEQSLFTTPENIKLKNQIIMQKIDDQIKCYSKLKISLSKYQQPLKSPIVQQSFVSARRVNN